MRPMRRLWPVLTALLGLTLLAAPPVSAAVAASIENRVSGSPSGSNNLVGIEPRLSEEAVGKKVTLAYELASDAAVAARGTARNSRMCKLRFATGHGILGRIYRRRYHGEGLFYRSWRGRWNDRDGRCHYRWNVSRDRSPRSNLSGGEAAVIGTAAAVSDIAGGAIVGATLGAAAGVVVVAVGGAGYGFGTMIYPWVDRNLIGPLYGF